jgi:hypothetical protein
MSFSTTTFQPYRSKLEKRADGFETIFKALEAMNKTNYTLLETGTCRIAENWEGDGQSTRLFDMFLNHKTNQGMLYSIDIDSNACQLSRSYVSPKTKVVCADAITYLHNLPESVKLDLVYLDSYDLDISNPHPSSMHHVMEFLGVFRKNTTSNTILAIDDHYNGKGKGKYISQFLDHIGYKKLYEGYQVVYSLNQI